MVGTKPALEANDSQEDLVVSRSELGKCSALRVHVRHPYSKVSNHLGLQHSDFHAKRGGRPTIHPGRTF